MKESTIFVSFILQQNCAQLAGQCAIPDYGTSILIWQHCDLGTKQQICSEIIELHYKQHIIRKYSQTKDISSTMMFCSSALNTKGYLDQLELGGYQNYSLPHQTHITYDGCFNQLKYSIGKKAAKPLELHLGYARAQNKDSVADPNINDYLTIFTKGAKDGQDRDHVILNSVIALDISGSMNSPLSYQNKMETSETKSRLALAKEAIMMFYSKLRPDDSFGLIIFTTEPIIVLPVEKVGKRTVEEVAKMIREIKAGGSESLLRGFKMASQSLSQYLIKNQCVKSHDTQNRVIMLTDVCDTQTVSTAEQFTTEVRQSEYHLTIVGISGQFRSDTCESLQQVKGFNYFCATEDDDIKKYLFENFSFTFFPSEFDIEISIENDNTESIEVFGTPDSKNVSTYNATNSSHFVVTKIHTCFPSEIEVTENGEVKTYGGLILVKLHLRDKERQDFTGRVLLSYKTSKQEKISENYEFEYKSPMNEQFYSQESLYEALSGYFYVSEVKQILRRAREAEIKEQEKYIKPLENLKQMVPASKLQELQKLIDNIKENVQAEIN